MGDAIDRDRLAPVTLLPWVSSANAPTESVSTGREGPVAGPRPVSGPRPVPVPEGVGLDASESPETGVERDARIDRMVVLRLRRSALSVAEVRRVLAEHGLDEAETEEWIARYERLGYLDDRRLAEQVVYTHGVRRGRGSTAIVAELARRGVDADAIRSAVEDLDSDAELDAAIDVAERRARQLRGLEPHVASRRLSAFLARRGYPGDIVREAVTKVLAADAP